MGNYILPLVGFCKKPTKDRLMEAKNVPIEPPAESELKLFQLLPKAQRVSGGFRLAGVHSGPTGVDLERRYEHPPSHTVTALYTPNGSIEVQKRILACRISLLDQDHGLVETPDRFHDKKVNADFGADERDGYTDWVDSSFTETQVNGHKRTVLNRRQPMLSYHEAMEEQISRPVDVRSVVVQSTPWGTIEAGMSLSGDPDPGVGLETVKGVADIVTEQAESLPRPKPADDWPLFRGFDRSKFSLATEMKSVISELSDQDHKLKHEDEHGAILTNLLDRMCEDYELTRSEAGELIDVLEQNDELAERSGIIRLA